MVYTLKNKIYNVRTVNTVVNCNIDRYIICMNNNDIHIFKYSDERLNIEFVSLKLILTIKQCIRVYYEPVYCSGVFLI